MKFIRYSVVKSIEVNDWRKKNEGGMNDYT